MLADDREQSIAAAFVRARLSATSLQKYPGEMPRDSISAYACQEHAIELWPDTVAGWKVARVPPDWEQKFSESRINGPVFSRNVHVASAETAAVCPIFVGGFAAVETEIAIQVKEDAPANKTEWTHDEACEYVEQMCIGIEVASSPLATLNELGTSAVISDFGNNWGVVIGAPIDAWRTLESIDCETLIDGISVGKRAVSIESGPLAAFAFTLGKCASRGRPLRRGAWITTGMITGVHDIKVGQTSRHLFKGHGEVQCHAVVAVALRS